MASDHSTPTEKFYDALVDSLREYDRRLMAIEAIANKVEKRLDELEARHDESQIEAALRLERKRLEAEQIARGEEFFNKSTRASAE
jgi:hypothetical protein